jgi:phage terminase large subunit GpA-like protein
MLPAKASAEAGRWRTDRTPYLREPMECLSRHSPVQDVTILKGVQVGGTEVLNNWIGYTIAHDPAPMMIVQPTVEMAERWSKQRLAAMIEETPALAAIIAPARSRDSGNTTLLKEFPGGLIVAAGANSPTGLRSMPVARLGLDEVDAMPDEAGDEGSPCDLAERRTATFGRRRKVLRISTPTITGASMIWVYWERSDGRQYHLPCPVCSGLLVLRDSGLMDSGEYLCEHCAAVIHERHKTAMLEAGQWIPQRPGIEARGYHIPALLAPLGLGYSWREVAAMRAAGRSDELKRKSYVNTILGETYEDRRSVIESAQLDEHRASFQARRLPTLRVVLTVGVDVQADRFAILWAAWGEGDSCYLADYVELPGDPTSRESWADLWQAASRPVLGPENIELKPTLVAIDSGAWTAEVYRWASEHAAQGVIAVKGLGERGKPVIGKPSKPERSPALLWPVGVTTAKTTLLGRLRSDLEREESERQVHIARDIPGEYLHHLAGERFDPERRRWVRLAGRRVEMLDCWVYSYAAACHPAVRLPMIRSTDWEAIEEGHRPKQASLIETAPPAGFIGAGRGWLKR